MILLVSNLYNKSMRTITDFVNIKLSKYSWRIWGFWSSTYPKFHCFFRRSMEDEFISLLIISSSSLNSFNIGSMTKFRKSKASDIFSYFASPFPFIVSFGPQNFKGFIIKLQSHYKLCWDIFIVLVSWEYEADCFVCIWENFIER